MIPQIEKTYPAGVTNVGFASEICAVTFPPMMAVLPAKPLTIIVRINATILAHLKIDAI
jgi:hypothetical protein